ncbi:MAG: hypothetical protein SWE60_19570, partial [Thermodesulfobacteriota bacterium]|nr:hypothetical protein [Thermodesulfobacteriota bacterium]
MDNRKEIIGFVRGVLGCQCPDEVFEKIESHMDDHFAGSCLQTVTIGNRLLVYIWPTNDLSLVKAYLPGMLRRGMKERDQRGLNRFRAVVATDGIEPIGAVAEEIFTAFRNRDDKVHLHVVLTHECPKQRDGA